MDPMNRFYVDAKCSSARDSGTVGGIEGVYANGSANGIDMVGGRNGIVNTTSKQTDIDMKSSMDDDIKDKKHKKKKKRKKRSYSPDSTTTSSSSQHRNRNKKKKRKHKSNKKKRSSSHRRHEKSNRDTNKTELEELRRRRHARESNERERLNNSRGDASSSLFDGSTIQTKDGRCYDGSNGFH